MDSWIAGGWVEGGGWGCRVSTQGRSGRRRQEGFLSGNSLHSRRGGQRLATYLVLMLMAMAGWMAGWMDGRMDGGFKSGEWWASLSSIVTETYRSVLVPMVYSRVGEEGLSGLHRPLRALGGMALNCSFGLVA